MRKQSDWKEEFSADYDVPAKIVEALYDESWHNNSCPSFIRKDDPSFEDNEVPVLCLYVEHPDKEKREWADNESQRFVIVKDYEETLLTTDDVDTALDFILKYDLKKGR